MKRSGVVVVAVAVALLSGCGPSPEAVCNKTYELVKTEAGEAAASKAIGGDIPTCIKNEEARKERQGIFKYKSNNECLMAAKNAQEAKACSSSGG